MSTFLDASVLPLFVAVPLLAAALLVVARRRALEDAVLVGAPILISAGAVLLMLTHLSEPVLAHAVGGFSELLSIPFVSDPFTALMLLVTSLSTLAAS
ncbi:MAG: monovalent cation/H+ antiporter subunit D family protein, partial [Brachybacterium sp.]